MGSGGRSRRIALPPPKADPRRTDKTAICPIAASTVQADYFRAHRDPGRFAHGDRASHMLGFGRITMTLLALFILYTIVLSGGLARGGLRSVTKASVAPSGEPLNRVLII